MLMLYEELCTLIVINVRDVNVRITICRADTFVFHW